MDSAIIAAMTYLEGARRRAGPRSRREVQAELRQTLAECARLTQCEKGSIWILDQARGEIRCLLALAGEEKQLASYRLRVGEGITGTCVHVGEPLVSSNAGAEKRHNPRVDQMLGMQTRQILCHPLISRGRTLGTVNVLNRRPGATPEFHDGDLLVARLFAAALADLLDAEARLSEEKTEASKEPRRAAAERERASGAPAREQVQPLFTSEAMQRIAAEIRAARERNLLLTGETGVGKDLLARWAHQSSRAAEGPFVAINLGAVPNELWESEIFGHVKGAFTGATAEKPGRIEGAHGGTLFLNEIGEMPPLVQSKLLSFLDTGEFSRIGENRMRKISARIIAATNVPLDDPAQARGFRRDLYYRLARARIHVPPLRERPADVMALASERIHELASAEGAPPPWMDESTRALLVSYPWPGNTRELYSAVETAFYRCWEGDRVSLLPEHFPVEVLARSAPGEGIAEAVERPAATIERAAAMPAVTRERMPAAPAGEAPASFMSSAAPAGAASAGDSILENSEMFLAWLARHRCRSSGRYNFSAAHRELADAGRIAVSLRTFTRRAGKLLAAAEPGRGAE